MLRALAIAVAVASGASAWAGPPDGDVVPKASREECELVGKAVAWLQTRAERAERPLVDAVSTDFRSVYQEGVRAEHRANAPLCRTAESDSGCHRVLSTRPEEVDAGPPMPQVSLHGCVGTPSWEALAVDPATSPEPSGGPSRLHILVSRPSISRDDAWVVVRRAREGGIDADFRFVRMTRREGTWRVTSPQPPRTP